MAAEESYADYVRRMQAERIARGPILIDFDATVKTLKPLRPTDNRLQQAPESTPSGDHAKEMPAYSPARVWPDAERVRITLVPDTDEFLVAPPRRLQVEVALDDEFLRVSGLMLSRWCPMALYASVARGTLDSQRGTRSS